MRSLRTALFLLAGAGAVFGLIGLGLILTSRNFDTGRPFEIWQLVIGWSFIGTGLFAWWRRPENGTGALMTAVGFASLIGPLVASDTPAVFIVGVMGGILALGVLIHMLLAYPGGRIEGKATRLVVVAGYLMTTVLNALPFLFLEPAEVYDCPRCPPNPILVTRNTDLGEALMRVEDFVSLGVVAALAVVLAVRWRRADTVRRRELAPVLIAGCAAFAIFGLFLVGTVAGLERAVLDGITYAALTALALVPFAFLAGILRSRLTWADSMRRLIERLGAGTAQSGPRSTREALAEALGDLSLRLAYWLPEEERFVDADGCPYVLDEDDPSRRVTLVEHEGRRVAAIVHDRELARDSGWAETVAAAAGLALENERLAAELRARLEELRRSRARIVEVGDAERRNLGRDLHDGAQQQLVALLLDLQLANEIKAERPHVAWERVDRAVATAQTAITELRELAAGVHPAILTQRGLEPALDELATRSPVAVEIDASVGQRPPPGVESAVYFVVSEALTNVAKHARADLATVRVVADNGHLTVEVADDGIGGADSSAGTGLRGLADRVGAFDGSLAVTSPPGGGTVIRAHISLNAA